MLLLACPNCGDRNVSEFRFGGELNSRPKDPSTLSSGRMGKLSLHAQQHHGCANGVVAS